MSESVWTSKKPDRAGLWWFRESEVHPSITSKVMMDDHQVLWCEFEGAWWKLANLSGQWSSSPIAEPKQAETLAGANKPFVTDKQDAFEVWWREVFLKDHTAQVGDKHIAWEGWQAKERTFTRLDCVATEGCKATTETEQKP